MDRDIKLLKSKSGIYGLFYYGSAYVCSAQKMGGAMHSQIRRVYDFKKHGKHGREISDMITETASRLMCSSVWAIPPSTVDEKSALQDIFGSDIGRVADAKPRKYNHNAQVDVSGLVFPESAVGKVLLVDDIATTGRSMIVTTAELAKRGIQCEMLVVGMSWKIVSPESPSVEEIEAVWRSRKVVDDTVEEEDVVDEVSPETELLNLLETLSGFGVPTHDG